MRSLDKLRVIEKKTFFFCFWRSPKKSRKNYTETFCFIDLKLSFLELFDGPDFLSKNMVSLITIHLKNCHYSYLKMVIICHYFMFSSRFFKIFFFNLTT